MTSYTDKWEIIEGHDVSGGQGSIKKVRNKSTGKFGALKCLLDIHTQNTERRSRFAREVKILEALNIDGIPKKLEDNINSVDDKNISLYYISEWIEGENLTKHVQSNNLNLNQIIDIIIQLCDLIQKCHSEEIYHRDIKPDNIMVDDNGLIFLIDFGISFKEGLVHYKTKLGQELGNRFFRIPDYSAGTDRKDSRGDITMIVGILFFLITKKAPRVLLDKQMQPPNIAMKEEFPSSFKDSIYWDKIERIFNIGFQASVNLRFQKVAELKEMCHSIFDETTVETTEIKLELEKFDTLLTSVIADSWIKIENQILELSKKLEFKMKDLAESNGLRSIHNSGYSFVTKPGEQVEFTYALVRKDAWKPEAQIWHYIELIELNKSYMEASFKLNGSEKKKYITCLTSDLQSFEEKIDLFANQIFTEALKNLREQLTNIIQ